MEKIIFTRQVESQLEELVMKLYYNDYFGFLVDANNYVHNIKNFIETIPTLKPRFTLNKEYGTFYCKYKHNYKTTWYIGFDREDDIYLIKFITNNHSAEYPKLF